MSLHNLDNADFEKILSYKDSLKANALKLKNNDPNDHYWQDISDDTRLVRNGLFLETNMITSWIGDTKKPRRILEIGTRTGGSLIALLTMYSEQDYKNIEEIVSFDMWREYISTTPFARFMSRLMNRKNSVNISERYTRFIGGIVERNSTNKVRRNLQLFNIKSDKIQFVSGNSLETVPAYFEKYPEKKFDYILVDGGHDEHTAECDLENVVNHVAPKGIILFDDIMPESYNLITVWEKFKARHQAEFDFYEIRHRKGMAWAVKK